MRRYQARWRAVCCHSWGSFCYQHDSDKADERRRNASKGGRSKGGGPELAELKKRVKDLARDVLT
jgi:hypothetical protein